MKKALLLNSQISSVISLLGHGDSICVGDAGLPIPNAVERIDLAVRAGIPSFLDTLSAVSSEVFVEGAVIASELETQQPGFHAQVIDFIKQLEREQGNSIGIESVSHNEFKALTKDCKAVVRTGEFTPYANVILYSGVPF